MRIYKFIESFYIKYNDGARRIGNILNYLIGLKVILKNPDDVDRVINSPNTVYQVKDDLFKILKIHGRDGFDSSLQQWIEANEGIKESTPIAKRKDSIKIIADGKTYYMSPGGQNIIIENIYNNFSATPFKKYGNSVFR